MYGPLLANNRVFGNNTMNKIIYVGSEYNILRFSETFGTGVVPVWLFVGAFTIGVLGGVSSRFSSCFCLFYGQFAITETCLSGDVDIISHYSWHGSRYR